MSQTDITATVSDSGFIAITLPVYRDVAMAYLLPHQWDRLVAAVTAQRAEIAERARVKLRNRLDAGIACWVDGDVA